ncbi:spore germination protein [Paenibacillus aurantius]|uniref:Spore germination protein n=1 Tax=Paenibacillus aurantius TaxID=2918900 RepID=A0AA96LDR2_9BACL|nr:spore germination protein [Paenibacillus aurantius]WNQ11902.1 spore germination protein [Paenibacillus aurantius]
MNNRAETASIGGLTEETLLEEFAPCGDVLSQTILVETGGQIRRLLLLYAEGLTDRKLFTETVLPALDKLLADPDLPADSWGERSPLPLSLLDGKENLQKAADRLFSGSILLYNGMAKLLYSLDIASLPGRQPEESSMEVSVKGARDGFVEELSVNVALVRKRIRTSSLAVESFVVGRRSRTKVSVLYVTDVARREMIQDVRDRLRRLEIDALLSAGHLEELLSDNPRSFFPLTDYIGRPDHVVECLMKGRAVILLDGAPNAIIVPANLLLLLKSPEDSSLPYYYVSLERFIRLLGLFVALFLPGFWVALTAFNMDQLPFPLLATIINSRIGLPLSAPLEAFLMIFLFEVFREAGVRLPKPVGQTIAVVGGLIVGDAAIRAGFTSPTMLVITAFTAVANFTLVNQGLAGAVTIIRLIVLLICSAFGMYGFFLSLFALLLYLSTLSSFGMPYLSPLSPPYGKDILASAFRLPPYLSRRRASSLAGRDTVQQGDSDESK